jgi:hypothetical protein
LAPTTIAVKALTVRATVNRNCFLMRRSSDV